MTTCDILESYQQQTSACKRIQSEQKSINLNKKADGRHRQQKDRNVFGFLVCGLSRGQTGMLIAKWGIYIISHTHPSHGSDIVVEVGAEREWESEVVDYCKERSFLATAWQLYIRTHRDCENLDKTHVCSSQKNPNMEKGCGHKFLTLAYELMTIGSY